VKSELEATSFDYRVFNQDPDEYVAHADLLQTGDVGIITGMQGHGLLRMLAHDLSNGSLRERGIVSLQGYTLPIVG